MGWVFAIGAIILHTGAAHPWADGMVVRDRGHQRGELTRRIANELPARLMLAAAAQLRMASGLLAVLAAVLPVRTALGNCALARGMGALVGIGHERVSSRAYPMPFGAQSQADTAPISGTRIVERDGLRRAIRIEALHLHERIRRGRADPSGTAGP